jgi:ketosteroid isomerase-like protein
MARLLPFAVLLLAAACARPAEDPMAEENAIRGVIASMEAAWNRGDFRGYMSAFQNPGIVFVSCGRMQRDWRATLDHYRRDYGGAPERRGRLHFRDIRIEMLAPDAAQLVSRYRLDRAADPQDGVNTRLMRKVGGRWVIALNHVSARGGCPPPDRS